MKRVAVLFALCMQAVAALKPAPDLYLAVGVHANRALERPVAGISVAVARGGTFAGPAVARGFGFADADRKVPVTPDTIFHVASISKYIEAAVALRLVEQGKLSLDDDITKYVAEAPTQGRRVTLRQLLSHTSGIYSFTSLPDADANERLELTHAQVLALVKDRPFDFAPGTSWRYSNTGYYLVGMAIERVTGQTYARYVSDEVFRPLGMSSSSLCTPRDRVAGLAEAHDVRAGALVAAVPITWALPFAAGAICSTARDLIRWQDAIDSGRFISRAHVEEMRTPTVLADGTRIDYGLGTRLGTLEGHATVGHTGGGGGFSAMLQTFPADHLTVVVLTNTSGGRGGLAAAIARSALEIVPPQLAETKVPADEAAALAGTFDSDEGTLESYACGEDMCSRPPGVANGLRLHRQAPFIYAVDADTVVRFQAARGPVEWAFAYSGGLFADAKRRLAPR